MSWQTIEDALQLWASIYFAGTVIWKHQDAPQPARPYVELHIGSIQQVGDDIETLPNSLNERTVYGDRNFTLTIRYFGSETTDASSTLTSLLQSVNQFSVRSFLRRSDIIVLGIGNIIDTTFLEQDNRVERAESEIFCRTSVYTTYGADDDLDTSWIDTVNINELYEPNDIIITQSISK